MPPSERPKTVLMLEDDPGVARLQSLRLVRAGFSAEVVATPDEAMARIQRGGIDLLVLDNQLSVAEDGLSFYQRLKEAGHDLPVILVTGHGDDRIIVRALRAGVRDYVFKSVEYLDYLPEAVGRVIEQERTKAQLRESQSFSRNILDSLGAHIVVLSRDGVIVTTNAAWDRFARENDGELAICGSGANYLEVCRRSPTQYGEEAAIAAAGIESVLDGSRDFFSLEYPCHGPAARRWFTLQVTPLGPERRGAVVSHLDITERMLAEQAVLETNRLREQALADLQAKTDELRAATQQLWQAARLAGVGELAASIAHELNNPLGTVSLRIEGVLAKTPADDPRRRPLEVVDQEVERMGKLVGNLLHYSRAGRDQVSTVNVPEEVTRTIELTDPHLKRKGVEVRSEFHPDVPDIYADRQQLRQVLLNLFTNAGDAMTEGGRLTTRVLPGELPDCGPAVVVEVIDTGTGIPADVLPRVFDPFFTTKEDGKGTGLGLAICKRIIDQHKGVLEVESAAGRGTTVRVVLPVRNEANVTRLDKTDVD